MRVRCQFTEEVYGDTSVAAELSAAAGRQGKLLSQILDSRVVPALTAILSTMPAGPAP